MKLLMENWRNFVNEENDYQEIEEGALSDMDDAFRERLSDWADAAKNLGVSLQDLLGSMKHLPGAAGEAAMQALEWLGGHVKDTASELGDTLKHSLPSQLREEIDSE